VTLDSAAEKTYRQRSEIVRAFGERGHARLEDEEPVVQVLAHALLGHGRLEVHVGGGEHTNVGVLQAAAAQPVIRPALEKLEQLRLRAERELGDLVEEERSSLRHFDLAADPTLRHCGVGAYVCAEELVLEERLRQRRTIDLDEPPRPATRREMHRIGEQRLASSGGAGQKDMHIERGREAKSIDDVPERATPPEHAGERIRACDAGSTLAREARQSAPPKQTLCRCGEGEREELDVGPYAAIEDAEVLGPRRALEIEDADGSIATDWDAEDGLQPVALDALELPEAGVLGGVRGDHRLAGGDRLADDAARHELRDFGHSLARASSCGDAGGVATVVAHDLDDSLPCPHAVHEDTDRIVEQLVQAIVAAQADQRAIEVPIANGLCVLCLHGGELTGKARDEGGGEVALTGEARDSYLQACRAEALAYIRGLIPEGDHSHPAYRTVLEYPLRAAKGLRPALAIASCRALGGGLSAVTPTAAVLELLHNAFLVHDDVEDGSEMRRHEPTLSAQLGVPIAVHTGDTMLSLALGPLLDNMRLLDMGRALRILDLVSTMLRRTVEGQGVELTWIAEKRWDITPAEYVEMVTLKTAWYTFVAPLVCGALAADASSEICEDLKAFGIELGIAFQIRDDTLNLLARENDTGKESSGDLWEGKRTLILSHFFATASEAQRSFAKDVLARTRPVPVDHDPGAIHLDRALASLAAEGRLDPAQVESVRTAFAWQRARGFKTAPEIARLRGMLSPAIKEASSVAEDFARRAKTRWASLRPLMSDSTHRDMIESILDYTIARES
jgi:geranylgeranyl diphosphate synthase type II